MTLVGLFVGGRATRLGGVAKGLLDAHGEPVIERLLREVRLALPDAAVVLVGSAAAYAGLGLKSLNDDAAAPGPIGGLLALLHEAERRGAAHSIALACDLPGVDAALLERLARHAPDALAVVPRVDGHWNPLCARYESARALTATRAVIAAGQTALWRVLERLGDGVAELPLEGDDAFKLRDWDTPDDVRRG